jgi:hypothetical protein
MRAPTTTASITASNTAGAAAVAAAAQARAAGARVDDREGDGPRFAATLTVPAALAGVMAALPPRPRDAEADAITIGASGGLTAAASAAPAVVTAGAPASTVTATGGTAVVAPPALLLSKPPAADVHIAPAFQFLQLHMYPGTRRSPRGHHAHIHTQIDAHAQEEAS